VFEVVATKDFDEKTFVLNEINKYKCQLNTKRFNLQIGQLMANRDHYIKMLPLFNFSRFFFRLIFLLLCFFSVSKYPPQSVEQIKLVYYKEKSLEMIYQMFFLLSNNCSFSSNYCFLHFSYFDLYLFMVWYFVDSSCWYLYSNATFLLSHFFCHIYFVTFLLSHFGY